MFDLKEFQNNFSVTPFHSGPNYKKMPWVMARYFDNGKVGQEAHQRIQKILGARWIRGHFEVQNGSSRHMAKACFAKSGGRVVESLSIDGQFEKIPGREKYRLMKLCLREGTTDYSKFQR